jgi:hypothetical protein
MAKHKKLSLGKALMTFIMIAPSIFNIITKTISLIGSEARLAGRSFVLLIILAVMMGALLTATWVGLLGLLIIYLLSLGWSLLAAAALTLAINILFMLFIAFYAARAKNNLTFPETRHQFQQMTGLKKD